MAFMDRSYQAQRLWDEARDEVIHNVARASDCD
jgi:hypothetical protein